MSGKEVSYLRRCSASGSTDILDRSSTAASTTTVAAMSSLGSDSSSFSS